MKRTISRPAILLALTMVACAASSYAQPVSVSILAHLRTHVDGTPIDLSPGGEWIARTVMLPEKLRLDNSSYSATGVPLWEGDNRMQVSLTHAVSGESIVLGDSICSSWSPVWSPDGKLLAYYSDQGGEAGLWLWEASNRRSRRISDAVLRTRTGIETTWNRNGRELLCTFLHRGVTIGEANAGYREFARFPPVSSDQPSVFVLRSPEPKPDGPSAGRSEWKSNVDLAIVDVATQELKRIAENVLTLQYAFSPDGNRVLWSDSKGDAPNTQHAAYDLKIYDVSTAATHTLVKDAPFGGFEFNWAPDGKHFAYIEGGQRGLNETAQGALVVVSLDGSVTKFSQTGLPDFSANSRKPLWDATSEAIYLVAKGDLWRVNATNGLGKKVATIPGYLITWIMGRPELGTLWTTGNGNYAWVRARELDGKKRGFFRVDISSGATEPVYLAEKSLGASSLQLDACDDPESIAFVASDQQHLSDVWLLDTKTREVRQVTHVDPALEKFPLGTSKLISWRSLDGQPLQGALLLPPNYLPGRRYPLVVWVYGGDNGSRYAEVFGFWSDPVLNLQVLATRGYAVLYPDAPLKDGTPVRNLTSTVLPGVNAAIDQGYADPDRLAIVGQSYGAYCAMALITETARFKAAILTAPVNHPDLLAGYLRMGSSGVAINTGLYETGQGRTGGTPWQFPERYRENSPIFAFDRIQTPVLIGKGEKDNMIDGLLASDAIFVALRRLGKAVEYRIYENEGHIISQPRHVIDFWNRRFDFLTEHLDLTLDDNGAIVFDGNNAKSRKRNAEQKQGKLEKVETTIGSK